VKIPKIIPETVSTVHNSHHSAVEWIDSLWMVSVCDTLAMQIPGHMWAMQIRYVNKFQSRQARIKILEVEYCERTAQTNFLKIK